MIAACFHAVRCYSVFHEREIAATKLATSLSAEARPEMLHRQLSPHFFNSLNAMSTFIDDRLTATRVGVRRGFMANC